MLQVLQDLTQTVISIISSAGVNKEAKRLIYCLRNPEKLTIAQNTSYRTGTRPKTHHLYFRGQRIL